MTARSGDGSTPGLVLRRWQEEALPLALAALEGRRNGVVAATTGAGKSIFLAALLLRWRAMHPHDPGSCIVVTTPSIKLVEQLADTLAEHLGTTTVGRYYTKAKQYKREVVVCCNASVPSLARVLADASIRISVWVADEAHKTESDTIRGAEGEGNCEVTVTLQSDRRLGLTATPFRSEESERLSLFDEVVYRYPPADALRDGVIVPWRPVGWGDDRGEMSVDDACRILIDELGDRETRGPGVVNAYTIADAEEYAAKLTGWGIAAQPIHSEMSRDDQAKALAALKAGELDCLVHVAMLVEGVDFPWLRWMCLRRVVGARVRFIQEVGRVLRSAPGKTEAIVLDPNNLLGVFHLTYEEMLGWAEEEDADPTEAVRQQEEEDCEEKPGKAPPVVMAARVTALSRYVRQLHLALVAEGKAPPPTARPGLWRSDPATEKQRYAVGRRASIAKRMDEDHAQFIRKIATASAVLTKGIASDLMELFNGLDALPSGTCWTPASPVPIPPTAALLPVDDPRVYVAGAMSKTGWSAIAIVRGRTVLFEAARVRERGDSWAILTERAMRLARDRFGAEDIAADMADVVARVGPKVAPARVWVCDKTTNPAQRRVWAAIKAEEKASGQ